MSNLMLCPNCKHPGSLIESDAPLKEYLCSICPTVFLEHEAVALPEPKLVSPREARHSSKKQDWGTPLGILIKAQQFLGGIDLDPASSPEHNERVGARRIFTDADNGLAQDWVARSVWLNPPYGKAQVPAGKMFEVGPEGSKKYLLSGRDYSSQMLWTYKLLSHYQAGDISHALLLVNAETAATWFQPLWAYPILFIRSRLKFLDPDTGQPGGSPTHGSALVYLGPNSVASFHRYFGYLGRIAVAYQWE